MTRRRARDSQKDVARAVGVECFLCTVSACACAYWGVCDKRSIGFCRRTNEYAHAKMPHFLHAGERDASNLVQSSCRRDGDLALSARGLIAFLGANLWAAQRRSTSRSPASEVGAKNTRQRKWR